MYGDIADADGLIVGIPIYFWGASGQVKTWIDRLYPMIDSDFYAALSGKKIITVFAQGTRTATNSAKQ
jgi:multimeric flavodoxin WrbA